MKKTFETVYFQPSGINPKHCEVGMIHESDPEHIWYLDEPCKILISDVKIIPRDEVDINYKKRIYKIKPTK
jgi:hypothetical protein